MHTAFFGLPKNSQVIRVRGAAAPRVFLTRITCFFLIITYYILYNKYTIHNIIYKGHNDNNEVHELYIHTHIYNEVKYI